MSPILLLETSSPVCSVALALNGKPADYREVHEKNAHARVLTLLIDELLGANRLALPQLAAVAVSAGPGSYTGLRIGASVAKGLCYALRVPLIAVSTLRAVAVGLQESANDAEDLCLLPLIDARRMDVYAALYSTDGATLLPPGFFTLNETFAAALPVQGRIIVGGDGAEKAKTLLPDKRFQFVETRHPHARFLAGLAYEKLSAGTFEDVAYFEPAYINEAYAVSTKSKGKY